MTPKQGVHTLADESVGLGSRKHNREGTPLTAVGEDDSDYVEDGATLESDNDDLALELSNDAPGTIASSDAHNAGRSIRRA